MCCMSSMELHTIYSALGFAIASDPPLLPPQPHTLLQACDTPFEPVYVDTATGKWTAPSLANYREKRADWQAYIEQSVYKQDDGMPGCG